MARILRFERLQEAPALTPVKLTKKVVEAIAPHPTKEVQRRDDELKGFVLRVQPSGLRTYFIQYRDVAGRTRKLVLGRHGALTTEEARLLARQRLGEVARGDDPASARKSARKAAKQAQTVSELTERFLADHVEAKRKPRTAREYRRLLDSHVERLLGHLRVDAVSRADIESLHSQMRSTPTEANRLLAVLSKMFNLAESWRLRPLQSNPCYRIERYPEKVRDRFYSDDELRQLGRALNQAEQTGQAPLGHIAALRLLALTGCRADEVLRLRWEDVDLSVGVLRLPDAKAGARVVPLGSPAVALLGGLPRHGVRVVWGRAKSDPLTYPAIAATWKKIRSSAGLSDARLHDLRHTVGSYAGAAGLNAFMVRDLLGHKTLAMTGRYVSQDLGPLKRAADEVVSRVADALASTNSVGQKRRRARNSATKR